MKKHLLIDNKGNIYNKYGDKVDIDSISYSMIDKYGFDLNEIVDKNILVGKKIVTYSNKNIKLKIKPNNIIPSIIILNKDLSMYDNICMNYSMKNFVSYDGKIWTSYYNDKILYEDEYNINLKSLNENNISDTEKRELKKMLDDFKNKIISSKKIIDNKIKYIAILIDDNRYFKNLYTCRSMKSYCKSNNNNKICVDKTTNKTSIEFTDKVKKLKVKDIVSDKIYDTIIEVKDNE